MSQNYEKPNKEDSSKLIFEHGGLLVYDIKGAVAEENLQLSTLTNNPSKFELQQYFIERKKFISAIIQVLANFNHLNSKCLGIS